MSAPEPIINPDLDAQLAGAVTDAATAASDQFVIDDLEKASWAVRKIAQHRARLAEATEVYVAERDRLDQWMKDEESTCYQATAFLEALLRRFHEERLADEGADPATATKEQWAKAKSKSIRLPAGSLVARRGPDSIEVDPGHVDEFVAWAEAAGHDDLVRVKKEPAKAAIKEHVGEVMADGRVVHEATGEFMPGVTWMDGVVRFKVETEGRAQ